jgi:peroxiredoxin
MKPSLRTSLLSLSLVLAGSLSAAVETGSPAPDFTLTDTTGATHSLSDFQGGFVVLEWTNHQCPFVVKHYQEGHMQALQERLAGEGVVWLQVVSSAEGKQGYVTAEEGESLRESLAMNSTALLLDPSGDVGRAFGARTTPHMYLIDPEGTLVYQGAIDSIKSTSTDDIPKAENYLLSAYRSAKAGEPVQTDTTTPYGCSVKY